jgi:hypothetical protein
MQAHLHQNLSKTAGTKQLKCLDMLHYALESFSVGNVSERCRRRQYCLAFTASASQSLFPGRGNGENNLYLVAANAAALHSALCLSPCSNIGL